MLFRSRSSEYFYRFNYPDNYVANGLSITKFERSSLSDVKGKRGGFLNYEFIRSYPISISSMPVSYETASLLKCTVSMTYIRYVLDKLTDPPLEGESQGQPLSPIEQASFNSIPDYLMNPQYGIGTAAANPIYNDFLNGDIQKDGRAIGNPKLDQFGVRDQLGR